MKTILVADDEFGMVETLAVLLEEMGYRVLCAANGKDALARAQKDRPDMALIDFMMPIADGQWFIRNLRALPDLASIPVVLMSAAKKSVALGGLKDVAFLAKPFELRQLVAIIAATVGGPC